MNIINFDFSDMKLDLSAISAANIDTKTSKIHDLMEHERQLVNEISRQTAKRNATLVAGAEASIEQRELIEQQLGVLREQNLLLSDNYDKLKEMYEAQVQENADAKDELKRSRRYNGWMMVVSVISMLAAIVSTVIPFLFEKLK